MRKYLEYFLIFFLYAYELSSVIVNEYYEDTLGEWYKNNFTLLMYCEILILGLLLAVSIGKKIYTPVVFIFSVVSLSLMSHYEKIKSYELYSNLYISIVLLAIIFTTFEIIKKNR